MNNKSLNLFKKKFILDFYENPGELLDEVNGVKAYRYLYYEDAEDNDSDECIMDSADFSDGDEPDDSTISVDFDEIDDYFNMEDQEEDIVFDIEYLEILIKQYVNA